MTDRLEIIFSNLPSCQTFADIGCDHGYIANAMIKSGKCKNFIISDVSAKCLDKAKNLLREYIDDGKGIAVVSDGFEKLPDCDLALVAGMGGEVIVNILKKAKKLPKNLVLQPMKNCDKVRVWAVKLGYKINRDFTFFADGKFYDLIVLESGDDSLTKEEIEFGRTNLQEMPSAFVDRLKVKKGKLLGYLSNGKINDQSRRKIFDELEKINKYV